MKSQNSSQVEIDTLCKAGAWVSIVSSCFIIFSFAIWAIVTIAIGNKLNTSGATQQQVDVTNVTRWVTAIFLIIVAGLQAVPIYLCSNLLKGKANSNLPAGIVSLLFSGLIGGILILVGKYKRGPSITNVEENKTVEEKTIA